jgi:hypothetical protein
MTVNRKQFLKTVPLLGPVCRSGGQRLRAGRRANEKTLVLRGLQMAGTVAIEPTTPSVSRKFDRRSGGDLCIFRRNSVPACSMCEFGTKCGQMGQVL